MLGFGYEREDKSGLQFWSVSGIRKRSSISGLPAQFRKTLNGHINRHTFR